MRESIGGGWLMSIVVLFIVLFSGYLAISINYSKAFKVKNYILSVIEKREGYTGDRTDEQLRVNDYDVNENAQTEIYEYLKNVGYASNVIGSEYCRDHGLGKMILGGVCLKKICSGTGNYYKVTTFLRIEFPVIDFIFKVPISGETKVIYYNNTIIDSLECT